MGELALNGGMLLLWFLLVLALMFISCLTIALYKAPPRTRPEIIRALAELMTFWKRK
ncbi:MULTISPECIES: hypothetical protein [Streptomyces]|nr:MULTISPECIES: hypothetical protein [Streptomyces]MCM9079610.1 hypothetical protein [Streptomyces spororaveus]MCX5305976.1 hypothetical protein [Streptomyces sp. NBC_00160]